jgi:TRAP-type C4-dicarboxylate transport system permease small subunit
MPFIEKLDRGLIAVLRAAVVLAVIVIFVLLLLGVLVRAVPLFSMAGYDEIVELLVAWAVFLGAVVLWREGGHFRVEFLQRSLTRRPAWIVEGVAYALALAFAVVFTHQSYHFAAGTAEMTAFFAMSKTAWYASMPVAGALMVLAALADLWRWALSHG